MTARTVAEHNGDEPDWLVPVTDTWARAAKITIPVPAAKGGIDSEDRIGAARRLVRTVADGREATVEDTAHYPTVERPDAFDEILGGS
ncbi:alpha/beta fold hydrolase [Streptomyces sp. NPDC056638]|uniref:alpha/beta fold hydrolase n=1 Tax=Streptomyces sp. NPDC056638 TaxID=3345887 RepID=UPI0036BA5E58